ncbi:MAG: hypothetical protein V4628_18075 [Pseudomonadota bacterium]
MTTQSKEPTVREAIGVFSEVELLREAIDTLIANGFEREKLGLLASEQVVKRSLGDFYADTNESHDSNRAPAIAFVGKDALGEAGQSLGGGLFFIGTAGVTGALVTSAAVLGGALLTAVGGVVGVGLVGLAVSSIIHQSDAAFLQHQIDEGRMLLFVRVNTGNEQQAVHILEQHKATAVKVHEVAVKAGERSKAEPV